MNNPKLVILSSIFPLLLVACAAAATPAQPQPRRELPPVKPVVIATRESYSVPAPTEVLPERQRPTAPGPKGMFFEDAGVNPFMDTYEDHLSTFAIDVDTASYSVARRYVNDGLLPPPEAVRVEEFVNYFEQDYPAPPEVAFGIYADGAPSPFDPGTTLFRIGIQGYEVPDWARKPASLTFVIDVSGSMQRENRLGLVKQSLSMLVDRLRSGDTVAIVIYGSRASVVLNPTSGEDRRAILNAIHSLRTGGSTNAEEGLQVGYRLAWQSFRPGAINRVILCSDGVANVGRTGPDEILETIQDYADAGITLTSVGFGMGNFNDVLMEQLADKGDGHYAYVDTLDEAEKLFVDDMTSTLQVIAKDVKVQVDFNIDVVARYRLIGYENREVADQDFRDDAVDGGEIGAGHSVTALYAVQLNPGAEGRIATVQLRWKDPDTHEVVEINGNFNTWELARSFAEASPRFQLTAVVAQYAEVLRQSPWAARTPVSQLVEYADRISSILWDDAEVDEFARLVRQASHLRMQEP